MRIEIGGKYRTRGGETVVIEEYVCPKENFTRYVWLGTVQETGVKESYDQYGQFYGDKPDYRDLVEEIFPEPNRTPIDQVTFGQLQRGVEKLWNIGRIW